MQRLVLFRGFLTAFVIAVALPGCGRFFPSANEIVSLSISPTSAFALPSGTQQFTATATFGNNTTGDVTSQVTWSSSATNVATISAAGLATAAASLPSGTTLANTTIGAKSGSVTATGVPMTVASKNITSIAISPLNPTITSGGQQQFTATATLSDGSMAGVSSLVSWTSSNTSVATINSSGVATGVTTGQATISATLANQTGTTTLTVQ